MSFSIPKKNNYKLPTNQPRKLKFPPSKPNRVKSDFVSVKSNPRAPHFQHRQPKPSVHKPMNARTDFSFSEFLGSTVKNPILLMTFFLASLPEAKAQEEYIDFSATSNWESEFENNPYGWPDNGCKKMEMGKSMPDSVCIAPDRGSEFCPLADAI